MGKTRTSRSAATPGSGESRQDRGSADPALRTGEFREKTGLLKRRRAYAIALTAEDFEQFRPLFDQVVTELFQWRQRRGRKTGAVHFHATVHPWIAGRVRDYLKKLRLSDSHAFLKQIPIYMELTAPDGESIDAQVLEPEGNAPARAE